MVIKSVNVLKLGIFQGAMMAAFGLIAGLFFLFFGSMLGSMSNHGGLGFIGGIGALIFLPIMYGIFGFIAGVISAFLYNLIAGVVGGIEIETE
ncbi:MAG: hypothetical protein E6K53_13135 [Gammaproteobacteria bacterium]|nr:MAG: hypothetical protein E6K53_13135 [Gammaproteobacteria bacterium]